MPQAVTSWAVGSYPTFSPLPNITQVFVLGGLFSVPLSLGLPPLGVTQHLPLWCPDFPQVNKYLPAIALANCFIFVRYFTKNYNTQSHLETTTLYRHKDCSKIRAPHKFYLCGALPKAL